MHGIIQKIGTLPDGSIRFSVDVPGEIAPEDLKSWMFSYVEVIKSEEYRKSLTRGPGDAVTRGQGKTASRKTKKTKK